MEEFQEFINKAKVGNSSKDEVQRMFNSIDDKLSDINGEIAEIESIMQEADYYGKPLDSYSTVTKEYGSKENMINKRNELLNERNKYAFYYTEIEKIFHMYKNFNKGMFFKNIRYLLTNNRAMRIGVIERYAGVRLGYTARLEKEDNTSEPSIEFIVSAAKLLNTSIDTLTSIDLTGLSSTDQYLVSFIDKLKLDTVSNKLDWYIEKKDSLNRPKLDSEGNALNPLLSLEEFYQESESDYPDLVNRNVFVSDAYGPNTVVNGDCFYLNMKNDFTLYLMNISKSVIHKNDKTAYAKEIWMYKHGAERQFLVGTRDSSSISYLADSLYEIVSIQNKHPRLKKEAKLAIDEYMSNNKMEDIEND